jgi:hypothetical protein
MSQWPSTYGWYPTEKWIPTCRPPQWYQVLDYSYGGRRPPVPDDAPWDLQPKHTWPYFPIPWEPKIFGAFPSMKFKMREDIGAPLEDPPGPWPSTPKYPPFGLSQVNTRPDGIYGVTPSPRMAAINVHMRPMPVLSINPHPSLWAEGKLEEALRQMTRKRPVRLVTESGTITLRSLRSPNWRQPKADMKGEKVRVVRPKTPNGKPDLFA